MSGLKAKRVTLRALEAEDLELLYQLENDMGCWGVSGTLTPFSRHQLIDYLTAQSVGDIYSQRQLRLTICLDPTQSIGLIDLYDFDPHHSRAGVGIIIAEKYQRQGYATEALDLLISYCRDTLLLNQIWASVAADNNASLNLFTKLGFAPTALRKGWIRTCEGYIDELTLQLKL